MQALLDNYPERYHTRLYRDLALVNAYLGRYDKAEEYVSRAIKSSQSRVTRTPASLGTKGKAPLTQKDRKEEVPLPTGRQDETQ